MHSELCTDPHYYNKKFPVFSRPKIIGFLSLDSERKYHSNTSQLKYANKLYEGDVHFDLNLGMDKANRRLKNLNEKISHLLEYLLEHEKRLNFSSASHFDNARFFCYRGLLTCIANTPYENREPWRIVATLHKGDIYLCALETDEKKERELKMSDRERICSSWGYKFEQFLLSDAPGTDPKPSEGVDENEEFSLVYESKLNQHTIVYGAEMDGIRCDTHQDLTPPSSELGPEETINYLKDKQFIELKTNAHLQFPNQHNNFRRFKTRKWWLQSFLAGVDTIVCGFRNQEGIVEQLKIFNLKELCKSSERFWKPNICINFLETFLTYVKRCLIKEIRKRYGDKALKNLANVPLISLHFEWSPAQPVIVTDNYCYDADPILPQWFVNSLKNNIYNS